ncbi:hypothetical protein ACFVXQ_26455 [Kitasatospora sp. NPDC058263]
MIPAFDHTVSIAAEARDQAQAHLNGLFRRAADHIERTAPSTALLVSGSIGRGEAAVTNRNGRWELGSDIDFALVLPDGADGTATAQNLIDHLTRLYPQITTTAWPLYRSDLQHARSHFARDLALAAGSPLTGTIAPDTIPTPDLGPNDSLQVITHQLATYLMPGTEPEHRHDTDDHLLRKLLLETLRALAPAGADGCTRHEDILSAQARTQWESVLPAAQVEQLLTDREHGRPLGISHDHAHHLFIRLIARFLAPATGDLPDELQRLAPAAADVMAAYQLALLAYTGLLLTDDRARYATTLCLILDRMGTTGLTDTTIDVIQTARSVDPTAVAQHRPRQLSILAGAMWKLRDDYYRHLGARMFGRPLLDTPYADLPLARTALASAHQ